MKNTSVDFDNIDRLICIKDKYYSVNLFDVPNFSTEELELIGDWCGGAYCSPHEKRVWELAVALLEKRYENEI